MPQDTRCTASATASTAIQQAIAIPTAVMAMILSSSSHGKSTDSTRVETRAVSSSVLMLRGRSRPQRTSGPTPAAGQRGPSAQVNMVLKNGSPTEMLPSPSCLCTSGSRVPAAAPPAWRPSAGRCCRAAATRATTARCSPANAPCARARRTAAASRR